MESLHYDRSEVDTLHVHFEIGRLVKLPEYLGEALNDPCKLVVVLTEAPAETPAAHTRHSHNGFTRLQEGLANPKWKAVVEHSRVCMVAPERQINDCSSSPDIVNFSYQSRQVFFPWDVENFLVERKQCEVFVLGQGFPKPFDFIEAMDLVNVEKAQNSNEQL